MNPDPTLSLVSAMLALFALGCLCGNPGKRSAAVLEAALSGVVLGAGVAVWLLRGVP